MSKRSNKNSFGVYSVFTLGSFESQRKLYIYMCVCVCVCVCMHVCMYVCMEKAMATHSSTLAWEIPWTEEPGGLQSIGVRHNWRDLAAAYIYKSCPVLCYGTTRTVNSQVPVHGISQARILDWVAIFFSRDQNCISHFGFFTTDPPYMFMYMCIYIIHSILRGQGYYSRRSS